MTLRAWFRVAASACSLAPRCVNRFRYRTGTCWTCGVRSGIGRSDGSGQCIGDQFGRGSAFGVVWPPAMGEQSSERRGVDSCPTLRDWIRDWAYSVYIQLLFQISIATIMEAGGEPRLNARKIPLLGEYRAPF